MKPFFEKLQERVLTINSLLCVGLDPHLDDLPRHSGQAAFAFCREIIRQTQAVAAAYKPNAAFFEALGPEGFSALQEVIQFIPDGIPVILDVKRGDISSTARAYAVSAFDYLGADAVTLNPYLGREAIEPFLSYPGKGAFVLCKTSNPGASDIQDLPLAVQNQSLYRTVAELVQSWNDRDNLGLVVGATQVESLRQIRRHDKKIWILAPGIGPQGGNLQDALRAGLRSDGFGLLIPVSRAISRSNNPQSTARNLRDQINHERETLQEVEDDSRRSDSGPLTPLQEEIARGLLELGCLQFGEFQLKSGQISPVYIDLRRLIARPDFLVRVATAYCQLLKQLEFDHLAALPYAALPITSAVSILGKWPMIYPRKETKRYGTAAAIEGLFEEGERAVVLDDLITTGGSKLEAIEQMQTHGLHVKDIVVLIDRSRHAGEELHQQGFNLHAYLSMLDLLAFYETENLVNKDQINNVRSYISA